MQFREKAGNFVHITVLLNANNTSSLTTISGHVSLVTNQNAKWLHQPHQKSGYKVCYLGEGQNFVHITALLTANKTSTLT